MFRLFILQRKINKTHIYTLSYNKKYKMDELAEIIKLEKENKKVPYKLVQKIIDRRSNPISIKYDCWKKVNTFAPSYYY